MDCLFSGVGADSLPALRAKDKSDCHMLEIKNLHAKVGDREILRGLDLTVRAGEVHAIMGPNGSGKSTLAHVLAGRPGYTVTAGSVLYKGKDLLALSPEERAREGVFLAFQYPVEIPGVSNAYFLKAALNAIRKHRGQPELDAMDFLALVKEKASVSSRCRCWSPPWPCSTRPTPASTSTPCGSSRTASTSSAIPSGRWWW